ncbi:MAG TPA: zf-HC2 domain-containing protein [Actinomycetota bacterium]|nr:zf-HC2 domain-containing protein [Actinomycetota bacterium]
MECREAAEHLPAYLDAAAGPAATALEAHLGTCSACRADLDRYRALSGALAGLASRTVEPPAWLQPAIISSLRAHSAHRLAVLDRTPLALTDRRLAAAGGALVLGVASAAGVAVLARRNRRRRTRLRAAIA